VTSEPAAPYGQQHAEMRARLLAEYEANAGDDEHQDDDHKDDDVSRARRA